MQNKNRGEEERKKKMCLIKHGFESAEVLMHACVCENSTFSRETKSLSTSKASILLQHTKRSQQKLIF